MVGHSTTLTDVSNPHTICCRCNIVMTRVSGGSTREMVMIEREAALAELSDVFDRCGLGTGGVVIVRGTVATGKTALLHAFAGRVAGRTRFLSAAGSPAERNLPFGVIDQLLHGSPV